MHHPQQGDPLQLRASTRRRRLDRFNEALAQVVPLDGGHVVLRIVERATGHLSDFVRSPAQAGWLSRSRSARGIRCSATKIRDQFGTGGSVRCENAHFSDVVTERLPPPIALLSPPYAVSSQSESESRFSAATDHR